MSEKWSANNYHELNDVEIEYGKRTWVRDAEGVWYLDCLAGYSANNFGHRHPKLIEAAKNQLDNLTLTARAYKQDQLEPFCKELGELTGKESVLPMNTGAEAVETALKLARKWGQEVKNIPKDQSNIIVMSDNFHGRTTTIVGFSDDQSARNGFGPYAPGFRRVSFGDVAAIENAIDENTAAVLLEPIQGEAGVIIPPSGFLRDVRDVCTRENVLMMADEIQSGFGRTGETFACDREGVSPDIYVLGKALGGGVLPVSAVCADRNIMDVIGAGEHGSTFGGNPLACAVGRAAIELVKSGRYQKNAIERGREMQAGLENLVGRGVTEVRGVGLWFGVDIDPALMTGRRACELLLRRNVLAKDTHGSTIRFSPPLNIFPEEVDFAVRQLNDVLYVAKR